VRTHSLDKRLGLLGARKKADLEHERQVGARAKFSGD
jgi:hypothetical protein